MKVLVGSENPVKVEAVREAFLKYFKDVNVSGIKVSSRVSGQPVNEEIFAGAKNRAYGLKRLNHAKDSGAVFFVGIEAGIIKLFSRWFTFSGICIIDRHGEISYGGSPLFELPENVIKRLLTGEELGNVMDELAGVHDVKQKQGAVGYFTSGVMDRKQSYIDGLVVALIPLLNKEIYFQR
ncbi:hypothetical protein CH330_05515 [candidate division WOR-3 bacterium JGI_Cruoil_03_51_56]|uniref:Probable inosine/xanthosine triphosphatase n=1 Tax=candidate division WOR-3 bacterium JGI_Cruoil_03_51_56 TaxID=1973747 RepID=A0A235BSQ1_UNCW3|nr:MAG: hypothetical protein CH330_05515 [candidate division WOR-3 bacterium JGI_Cruoil_03_51_56]